MSSYQIHYTLQLHQNSLISSAVPPYHILSAPFPPAAPLFSCLNALMSLLISVLSLFVLLFAVSFVSIQQISFFRLLAPLLSIMPSCCAPHYLGLCSSAASE